MSILVSGVVFRDIASVDGPVSSFHKAIFAGITPANIVVLVFAYCACLRFTNERRFELSPTVALLVLWVSFLIVVSVWTGAAHGSVNHFGDWKNLAMGAFFALGLKAVVRSEQDAINLGRLVVVVASGSAIYLLAVFFLGGGAHTESVGHTTVWNVPTLGFMIASVAISQAMMARKPSVLWLVGLTLPTIVVVLSFRRFAWTELAIAVAAVWFLQGRHKVSVRGKWLFPLGGAAVLLIAILATASGGRYMNRLATADPFHSSSSTYAATNQSHVDDIHDAWVEVKRHPFLGLGTGVFYVGGRTYTWRPTTGDIHNGPLHVWVKFGLIGLLTYLIVHCGVIWKLRTRIRTSSREIQSMTVGIAAFFFAQFVVSLTFVSWPYLTWGGAILTIGLVAAVFLPFETGEYRQESLK